jgi:hypothetical protein
MVFLFYENTEYQGFFSGKRGARTHKRGKDKHTESFVTISLYNITVYFITS